MLRGMETMTLYAVKQAALGRDGTGYDIDRERAPIVAVLSDLDDAQELAREICGSVNAIGFVEPLLVDDQVMVDALRFRLAEQRNRLERLRTSHRELVAA